MRPYSIVERTGEGKVPKTTEFGTTEKSSALLKHLAQVENSELSGESGSKMMQPSKVLREGRRAHQPRKTIASAQLPTWGNHKYRSVGLVWSWSAGPESERKAGHGIRRSNDSPEPTCTPASVSHHLYPWQPLEITAADPHLPCKSHTNFPSGELQQPGTTEGRRFWKTWQGGQVKPPQKDLLCSWIKRLLVVRMPVTPKLIYKFHTSRIWWGQGCAYMQ